MHVVGLDLGGTKIASALFDRDGEILQKEVVRIGDRKGEEVGDLITDQIGRLISGSSEVRSVGISVPGIFFSDSGRVWAPNVEGWEEYPLLDKVRSAFSDRQLQVAIDSDRACYILGEIWKGAARGCRHAVFLAVGTGIGAGILIDGRILRGAGDIAGSIGWMALKRPWREAYRSCGCFEYHASGAGLVKVARERLAEAGTEYKGYLSSWSPEEITTRRLFEAWKSDDEIAREVFQESVSYWGMAAANLVSLFNPEKILFGGGVFGPAGELINEIRREAEKWAQPISIRQVGIELSALGGEAGLIGAGKLALDSLDT